MEANKTDDSRKSFLEYFGFKVKKKHPKIKEGYEQSRLRRLLMSGIGEAIREVCSDPKSHDSSRTDRLHQLVVFYNKLYSNISKNNFYKGVSDSLLNTWLSANIFNEMFADAYSLLEVNDKPYFAIKQRETIGLTISALINNSDSKNFRFNDTLIYTDYAAAFLAKDKKVVVRGGTGENFGFYRDEGSTAYVDRLIDQDFNSKPSLLKYLYRSLAKESRQATKQFLVYTSALVGGMLAFSYAVSAAGQNSGYLGPTYEAITQSYPLLGGLSGFFWLLALSTAFYIASTCRGISDGIAIYKNDLKTHTSNTKV